MFICASQCDGQWNTDTTTISVRTIRAGEYIEQAGRLRTDALVSSIILAGIGAYETQRHENGDRVAGWSMIGASFAGYVSVQFVIGAKERKAGRLLQGKPPK